jgi:hypothetical protein
MMTHLRTQRSLQIFLSLVILISLAGFWNIYFGADARPTPYHHLHVISSIAWLALLLVQLTLIDRKQPAIHRQIGQSIVFVGPFLIASLILLSVHSASKAVVREAPDMLVIQNIFPALEIALLMILGVACKHNRRLHGHLLMSTALLFLGIALFFTLTSFVPQYRIEGPETFERFEHAASMATYLSVAAGIILFLLQGKAGWPWLMVSLLFFFNAWTSSLLTQSGQVMSLTRFIGAINEYLAFFGTFGIVLVVMLLLLRKS